MSRKIVFAIAICVFCSSETIDYIGLARPTFAQSTRVQVLPTLSQTPPDTCVQGYVWREAFPNDHVCVTPETRSQTAHDNSQAATRIDPVNQTYGSDTCIQGYVWREAIPSDHVCVTPEIRSQTAYDNSQAASRVIGQATTIPPKPSPPKFLGVSTNNKQEAISIALNDANRYLGGQYANAANDLLYKIIAQESGLNGGKSVSWVIIELESNPDYYPQIDCPQPSDPHLGTSCQPLPSACYFRDPRYCHKRHHRKR